MELADLHFVFRERNSLWEDGDGGIDNNLQWDEGGMDSMFGVNEPEDVRTPDDSRCGSWWHFQLALKKTTQSTKTQIFHIVVSSPSKQKSSRYLGFIGGFI